MICHNSFLIKHLLPNFCSTHTEVIRIFMWSIIRNALPLLLLVNFNFTIDTEATSLNTMGVNVFSKSLQLEKGNYDAIKGIQELGTNGTLLSAFIMKS